MGGFTKCEDLLYKALAANYYAVVTKKSTSISQIACRFCNRSHPCCKQQTLLYRIVQGLFVSHHCFVSTLSPLRDTLICNEGIARSDHVSPQSILPERSRLPTLSNQRRLGRSSLGAWTKRFLFNRFVY